MTPEAAWQAAINQLELQIRSSFDISYFYARFAAFDDGVYQVEVPSIHIKAQCERFQKILLKILEIYVPNAQVEFIVTGNSNGSVPVVDAPLPDTSDDASDEVQPERQPDEWYWFAKVPNHIIDSLEPGPGWLMVKFIRHINHKTNLLIRNHKQLADLFGLSVSTIQRHSKVLEKAGHLHIKPGKGRNSANEYRLIGQLAVAAFGVKIANETALQIKLESAQQPSPPPPNQPKSTEDDAKKVGQSDRLNEENDTGEGQKSVNLNPQATKVGQSDRANGDKVGQIELSNKIKSFSLSDQFNDLDNTSQANEVLDNEPSPATTEDSHKSIQQSGDDLEETKAPSALPAPTYPALAAWVQEWGEVTTSQNTRLKMLDEQYDPAIIQSAMRATIRAYNEKIVRYHSRLDYLETACKQRSGNNLAAVAVAAS